MSKVKLPPAQSVVRKAAQAEAAQVKAAQMKAAADEPVILRMDAAKLQEAYLWTEILGQPKCRKRHPRRSRLSGN